MNRIGRFFLAGAAALVLLMFNASADTHHVDVNSASPSPPYTDWSSAATLASNIWSYSSVKSYSYAAATNAGPHFYRIRPQE